MSSVTFSLVVILGLWGLSAAAARSPFFSFILLTALFTALLSFVMTFFWALHLHYKPAVYLGVLITSYTAALAYLAMALAALGRMLSLRFAKLDGALFRTAGRALRQRHIISLVLGAFLSVFLFYLLFEFSKPSVPQFEYTGDLTTLKIDYYTLVVPRSAVLLAPYSFRVSFPAGDVLMTERPLSPFAAEKLREGTSFGVRVRGEPDPIFSGDIAGGRYRLFASAGEKSLRLMLEVVYPDHVIFFRNVTKLQRPLKTAGGSPFRPAPGLMGLTDPIAAAKILWFIGSSDKILSYYKYRPQERMVVRGSYRTRFGVISTLDAPPFSVRSSSVVLALAGGSRMRIHSDGKFSATRQKPRQLAESFVSTLQGLV